MSQPTPGSSRCASLLASVQKRQQWVDWQDHAWRWLLGLAAAYAVALLAHRLLGLGPDLFSPWAPVALVPLALVLARLTRPATGEAAAARLVDRHAATHDLFLTRVCLSGTPGAYQPLVERDAEERAAGVSERGVVSPAPGRRRELAAGALAAVWLGVLLLPNLSARPARDNSLQVKALAEHEKLAAERAEVLRKAKPEAKVSQPVQAAMRELEQTLRTMRRTEQKNNLQRINRQQKKVGEQWRAAKMARSGQSRAGARQSFGGTRSASRKQWERELKSGGATAAKQELESVRQLAEKLAQASPEKRAAERSKLEQKLRELRDFAEDMGASELRQELSRLLQQLDSLADAGLADDALGAFGETLDVSALELDALAQSMRDLDGLERALEALRLAELLNETDPLDGEACDQCTGIGEYAELYRRMMGERVAQGGECSHCQGEGCGQCAGTGRAGGAALGGAGTGPGTGGAGRGAGGVSPESTEPESGFTPQRSRAALRAGRLLMRWKSTEAADSGDAELDYAEALRQVVQGASEAVVAEEVPPAYHEAIKSYFDRMGSGEKR